MNPVTDDSSQENAEIPAAPGQDSPDEVTGHGQGMTYIACPTCGHVLQVPVSYKIYTCPVCGTQYIP